MFQIIRLRKYWYILSLLVIIPGLISLFTQGLNLGIDFTGGNMIQLKFAKAVTVEDVRGVLATHNLKDSVIQQSGNNTYLIRTKAISQADSEKLINDMSQKLGGATMQRNDLVGPVIGKELARNAILALLVASVLMVIYISWRFQFLQGVAAIIALLHDVLVMIGLTSILRIQVDSTLVAAVLTIIGYSINDTVVIFDRIRENLRKAKKGDDIAEVVNHSLWQTMARSINTVLTVIFVLLAMFFFGGTTIHGFVTMLLIGVTSGAYSSIFNASPLWYDFQRVQKSKKQMAKAA